MRTNGTERLPRIAADTGLSITEAEYYLRNNQVKFDWKVMMYYIITEKN